MQKPSGRRRRDIRAKRTLKRGAATATAAAAVVAATDDETHAVSRYLGNGRSNVWRTAKNGRARVITIIGEKSILCFFSPTKTLTGTGFAERPDDKTVKTRADSRRNGTEYAFRIRFVGFFSFLNITD